MIGSVAVKARIYWAGAILALLVVLIVVASFIVKSQPSGLSQPGYQVLEKQHVPANPDGQLLEGWYVRIDARSRGVDWVRCSQEAWHTTDVGELVSFEMKEIRPGLFLPRLPQDMDKHLRVHESEE